MGCALSHEKQTIKAQTLKSTHKDKIERAKKSGVLPLQNAQLQSIPVSVFELALLQTLDLKSNLLKYIPDDITKLTKLKSLNICNNDLEIISITFCNLVSLRTVSYLSKKRDLTLIYLVS